MSDACECDSIGIYSDDDYAEACGVCQARYDAQAPELTAHPFDILDREWT